MSHRAIEKRLDNLWSALVKTSANFTCQICGDNNTIIDPHHIIRCTHKRLRWNPGNGIALCRYKCHRMAHDDPEKFNIWFEKSYSYSWDTLQEIKREGVKHYTLAELENIEQILKKELKATAEEHLPF